MLPTVNLSALSAKLSQSSQESGRTNRHRNSTCSTNTSMCSLSSDCTMATANSESSSPESTSTANSSRRNTNSSFSGKNRSQSTSGKRSIFTPFSSTSSLFLREAAGFGGAQMRRISVPFQKAGRSAAARRLSSFVSTAADAVNQEILMSLGEKPSSQPFTGAGDLNREWEIVTVRELCRRLSLEDSFEPSEMPLPEGAQNSRLLDEFMIRQIVDILPPRAEGYPWVNIYNSEKHGFSLATLYRKMSEWTEELSPVLLVIRDVQGHVFGAVASTALRPAEHYYGTGDSCLLFRFTGEYPHTRELRSYTWTGDNQFFVNATRDFLSMGGGGGHYGLWLDADLNNGRTQKCATFDNEPLAGGESEDFVVQFIEAFGFSMS
ncbi:TLD domain-containing protein [Ditylenchus destructor]|uniref:Oxidation resistance protein 1 n=1 Tax=Ditylenchus destructor TaxID=166010 RepID=A0AAD4NBY7_9BILA|nr:TLD domain-containing protein [Ditylenchus destructor]